MAKNLKIYSTDGRETSYGIYVNGTKQATVNRTWPIITTCTNGTYSGDNTINRGSGTATVTLSASSGYVLPETITVTNASFVYSSLTGTVSLSAAQGPVTISCVCEAVQPTPVKGDIITMNVDGTDRQYRVLKVNNTVAEVLSMYTPTTSAFDSGGTNTYAGKTLDTYLNSTWYNALTSTAKAAIVDKTFTQDTWYPFSNKGDPDYKGTYWISASDTAHPYQISRGNAFESAITRHIYALSIQDIIDYLEVTPSMTIENTTLTAANIWQMFFGSSSRPSSFEYSWLRSANAGIPTNNAMRMSDDIGSVSRDNADNLYAVRPAFQIDLSKIQYNINLQL